MASNIHDLNESQVLISMSLLRKVMNDVMPDIDIDQFIHDTKMECNLNDISHTVDEGDGFTVYT